MSDPGKAALTIRPPQILLERLGNPSIVVGFDIETHDWLDHTDNRGHIGELGWYTMKEESSLRFDRLVQLGWVISEVGLGAPVEKKTVTVRPDGFVVSGRATKIHKITHEQAVEEGVALADALQEFMADVKRACESGARVVAHQIEYDYRIIYEELGRCSLNALQEDWRNIARKGYCTMNPVLGKWILQCSRDEVGPQTTLGLDRMTGYLFSDAEKKDLGVPSKRHHAGADAQITQLIYRALLAHTNAWRGEAPR